MTSLDGGDTALLRAAFAQSVVRGLTDTPRWLSCRYLYDADGSGLFERITEQPEYYLTRTEDALLKAHAARLRAVAGPSTLVELGSGSSTKTRHMLRAWCEAAADPVRYVPIDISRAALADACRALEADFPTVHVEPLAGTYEQAYPRLRELSPLVLLFLGSSLGNFDREDTAAFLDRIAASLNAGDHLLLGIDLVKDTAALEAAYNDAAGVSAAFTRNLFARMNRDLGTRLDLDAIEHVAYWNANRERIDIFARFTRETTIELPELERTFRIAAGEMILTEVSRKFRPDEMAAAAGRHGFEAVETVTDPAGLFAVMLLRRRAAPPAPPQRLTAERQLAAARLRTLELVAPLDDAQLTRQHSPLMSPIVWDLGHIANFEEQWVRRADARSRRDDEERQRDHLYDAIAHTRAARARLPLLQRPECWSYLDEVRAQTLAVLGRMRLPDDDPLRAGGYVFAMLAQHEAQHCETMLQTISLIDDLDYEPPRREDPPGNLVAVAAPEAVIPAGPFMMGTDDRRYAYDNERPAHEVWVDRFRIDVCPVTNGQFLAFLEAGGYEQQALWNPIGWRWRGEAGIGHPLHWRQDAGGAWWEHAFGRRIPLAHDQPVAHVSWHEADAYARWAGKRLPTEAEWEKAAAWDLERRTARRWPWGDTPPTPAHANLDQRTFSPAALGAYPRGVSYFGCHHMIGDVWEWTASEFAAYPGFVAFPYPEYSEVHFGRGYKVLRGGSWATQPLVARNTFRNWDLPERRQIFAGFRCAADA